MIGTAHCVPFGAAPIRFGITYDPRDIRPDHVYRVRARVVLDGHVVFATAQARLVITGGHGTAVDLRLMRRS